MSDVVSLISKVSTATLTTQLLKLHGLRNASIRGVSAVDPSNCRFAGPAYTLRYVPLREDLLPTQYLDHSDNKMTPLVESIPAGSVLVIDAHENCAVGTLGGNIVARLKARGVAGVVSDGAMRDIGEIRELGMAMFMRANAPPPSFTELMIADAQCLVSCAGVPVFPGDIVVGDGDGVAVVPARFAQEVAAAGLALDELEAYVLMRLRRGEPLPGLYPPSAKVQEEYRRWVAAGRPDGL
jgi:regulator of RNase E activity RraA